MLGFGFFIQIERLFMKPAKILLAIYILLMGLSLTACRRSSSDVWEDTKSARRQMTRGVRTLGGKQGDSRAIECRDQFMPDEGGFYVDDSYVSQSPPSAAMPAQDFVPLSDQPYNDEIAMANYVSQQPRETPGDPGSSIPGIDYFQDPSSNPALAAIFRNLHFEYNSNLVRGQENLNTVHEVAEYLKRHGNTYVFVEGHCDERGPMTYNLALGAHRSNSVRNVLLEQGVNPDNVFTISYGSERPLVYDHNEEAWAQNRRAEFKVYQR
jgi:peptidoglycan-associated lipoprotein